jgi:hypothetical protein
MEEVGLGDNRLDQRIECVRCRSDSEVMRIILYPYLQEMTHPVRSVYVSARERRYLPYLI